MHRALINHPEEAHTSAGAINQSMDQLLIVYRGCYTASVIPFSCEHDLTDITYLHEDDLISEHEGNDALAEDLVKCLGVGIGKGHWATVPPQVDGIIFEDDIPRLTVTEWGVVTNGRVIAKYQFRTDAMALVRMIKAGGVDTDARTIPMGLQRTFYAG